MTVRMASTIQRWIGVAADTKPSSGVRAGSTFYVIDTGLMYVYDGSDWQVYSHTTLGDDDFAIFGGVAKLGWETADANANALVLALPEGGATDVPVFVIGDASILNADLGWFNGVTEPRVAVVDDDKDSYVALGFTADDAAAIILGGSAALTLPALTLGGAVAGGGQNITNLGDLTFASGKGINSALLVKNGDADDYWTMTVVSNIPTLYGTGAYARIGDAAATSHTLASEDDLMVSGKLEVDGATYLDGAATLASTLEVTGAATFNGNVVMGTMDIDDDSGAVTLVDMGVTDAPADGTEESIDLKLDGVSMFKLYGKSDGAGAVDERSLICGTYLQLLSTDTDGIATGQVWYDASENKLKFKTAAGVETIAST